MTTHTPKMSYFSDIDLATLHRLRLNERINYKLSWFNRRQRHCSPAKSSKSISQRNNAASTTTTSTTAQKIKSHAKNTHKLNTYAKETCQSINGLAEMSASNISGNDFAKITATPTTNRQRNNGHTNNNNNDCSKKKTLRSFNTSIDRWNHVNESPAMTNEINDRKHHNYNEPAMPNGMHEINRSDAKCTKNQTPNSKSNESTDRFACDNSSNRQNSDSKSNDAVANRKTCTHDVTLNKKNVTTSTVDKPLMVEQITHIDEENLELPHRKRSGTWP